MQYLEEKVLSDQQGSFTARSLEGLSRWVEPLGEPLGFGYEKGKTHDLCCCSFWLETTAGVSSPGLIREPYSPPVKLSHSSTSALLAHTAARDVAIPVPGAGDLVWKRINCREMRKVNVQKVGTLLAYSLFPWWQCSLHSSKGPRRHQRVRRILGASHRVKFYSINFS